MKPRRQLGTPDFSDGILWNHCQVKLKRRVDEELDFELRQLLRHQLWLSVEGIVQEIEFMLKHHLQGEDDNG